MGKDVKPGDVVRAMRPVSDADRAKVEPGTGGVVVRVRSNGLCDVSYDMINTVKDLRVGDDFERVGIRACEQPLCIAFDCFGTVFDMKPVPTREVLAYVDHVKRNDFSPFEFPKSWYELKAHPDSASGISQLMANGITCVTLSNGSKELLERISEANGITWSKIIDLAAHKAYKPNNLDAYRAVEKETGFRPSECLMITANPTFGDVQSSAAIGMDCCVIRHGCPRTITELAEILTGWLGMKMRAVSARS